MPKNISQSKDAKKWPTDPNFQAPRVPRRKVKMASANAVKSSFVVGFLCIMYSLFIFSIHLTQLIVKIYDNQYFKGKNIHLEFKIHINTDRALQAHKGF